jgi:hypothetical protein
MGVWSFWAGYGQGMHVLEPTSKIWPLAQKVEGRRKKFIKKGGCLAYPGVDLQPAGDHWSPASPGRGHTTPFFLNFFILKLLFFGSLGEWARAFGRKSVQHPHFLKLAPTLGSVKCSIPHRDWRFHFFHFFLNLDYTWTFISTVGIFVSWKIEITKNSSRFASVMEIFCTLLQWRVHVSMFHSSSTSKIWHTST